MTSLHGTALIDAVNATRPASGAVAFWWMGQQSWAVRTRDHTLYFDPYLTPKDRRRTPPLLTPDQLTNADFIFGTHDHTDHIDRPSLGAMAAASPRARFVMPRKAARTLPDDGVPSDRLVPMDDETVLEEDGLRVTAIKAQHETFDRTPEHGYPHLQYIVESSGATIYHAGDTLLYEGMRARLRSWHITVAFLPINGRDAERYERGCMGNMTWQEAADLAGELAPAMTCPAHYEMFANNSQDPEPFRAYMAAKYPACPVWIGAPGQSVDVAAPSSTG